MRKIIYLADDEDEQYAIKDFLEKRGIEVFPAQTEEEALAIIQRETSIRLIVIGVRENHTSALINSSPCDQIPKVPLIINENEQHLRAIYNPIIKYFNMDEKQWQEGVSALVDSL